MAGDRTHWAGVVFGAFCRPVAVSEKVKKSVIPTAFWYFSVGGGATLLASAIHRQDPVFIIGQGAGLFVYFRNLQFLWRDQPPKAPMSCACAGLP